MSVIRIFVAMLQAPWRDLQGKYQGLPVASRGKAPPTPLLAVSLE